MRLIYKFFFAVLGWKISGDVPRKYNKYIIIAAPHSSNWDFMIGLSVRSIMRFPSNFLAKKELFKPPFGWLFRSLGGYPVDRSKSSNIVDQVVAFFKNESSFVIAIAPEGTRSDVNKWKTGFYTIAVEAKVPIIMAGLDYKRKTVFWSEPLFPTGDLSSDALIIEAFYKNIQGKFRGVTPVLGKNQESTENSSSK